MRPPRSAVEDPQGALLQIALARLVDKQHPLVRLARVNVDTTVMEKNVRHPTDARPRDRAREKLEKQARSEGIRLRQSYLRVGKQTLSMQSRYAHAQQFKRARKATRRLKTVLGRVIHDVQRKASNPSPELQNLLVHAQRLHAQKRTDKGKLYSLHEPSLDCISKGKAQKLMRVRLQSSPLATTGKGGWLLAAKAHPGNPYDGHTLTSTLQQITDLVGRAPDHAFVDMGYRVHGYEGPTTVNVDKRRRGKTPKNTRRWMERRAATEPTSEPPAQWRLLSQQFNIDYGSREARGARPYAPA